MKLVDKLRNKMMGEIFTKEDLDVALEENKYYPIEYDDEQEEGILKYSNGKSQIWINYVREKRDRLICNITLCNKKRGKTTVHAFRNVEDIKKMMDYFRDNKRYDDFITFMLGLFLARRIEDTLSLKWSDFYEENGNRKEILDTLVEKKTDKIIDISLNDITWKYIDWYCEVKNINPLEHLKEDVIPSKYKENLPQYYSDEEYANAIEKQESAYRYQFKKAADFNDIKGVSTHSTRKTFVYIAHQINKFDPDNWEVLKTITGHKDIETLKRYADIMNEKGQKMYNDVGKYIYDIDKGNKPVIDNIPVVALKTNDLRDILLKAYNKGIENHDNHGVRHVEIMNQLLSMVEEMRVS